MLRNCLIALLILVYPTIACTDEGKHQDIFLWIENGSIQTGFLNAKNDEVVKSRVFPSDFGDSGFDGFTDNPGFDCAFDTFPSGSKIGFNVLDALKVWDGNGFSLASSNLFISFDTLEVVVDEKPVSGFELNVQPGGIWHIHYNYLVLDPRNRTAAPGIYLLNLQLYSSDPGIAPTEPFWIVFNHLETEVEHDAAIDWLIDILDPAACFADLDSNQSVDGADLGLLLAAWGTDDSSADLNGDDEVDGADLGLLLAAWGDTCS